jgi:Ca2+-binding RTX toxin-like protein
MTIVFESRQLQSFVYLTNLAAAQLSLFHNPFAPGRSAAMSFRSSFQLVLLCYFLLATLTPAHTMESILGSDGNDTLFGTSSGDQIAGGGGNGDDELRGGDGDDVLYGGIGIDRLYGDLGADRFVFEIDSMETDEVIDFNAGENDTVWLQSKYTDSALTADSIRIDREGDLEVLLANENWSSIVNLHQNNLELDMEEFTDGLRLRFIKRF